jgi:hypothetical protein
MPPTTTSSEKASPADSSPDSPPPDTGLCAIHQPNLFPRLSTLAKIFAADCWIVLDDVQFTQRDYQHRARIAPPERPEQHQWLTLPTHLPHGRSTVIRQARLVNPDRSRRRMVNTLTHQYGSSRYWPEFRALLDAVTDTMDRTDRTAVVAETSTQVLLQLLGWKGKTTLSSQFTVRSERSLRLADLVQAVHAGGYLCGPGGMTYLRPEAFASQGTTVIPFITPSEGIWQGARKVSALHALMTYGPDAVADEMRRVAAAHQISPNSHSAS